MTDNFALLDEPRRPWIDPGHLKEKFLALSAAAHPDRVHQAPESERQSADDRFSRLNAAYACLREPRDRLRHLLELESGARPADIERVPADLMTAFFEVGKLCQEADALLAEKARTTSPLLQLALFERAQEARERLSGLQQGVTGRREALWAELQQLNRDWESAGPGRPLERLEQIYRLLSYFDRWSRQLQERIVQLSF